MFKEVFPKIVDNVMKRGTAGQATDDNIMRRMRIECWIIEATDTHSEPDETVMLRNISSSALDVRSPLISQQDELRKTVKMAATKMIVTGKECDAVVTSHDPANNRKVRLVVQQSVDRLRGSLYMICGCSVL